MKLAMKNNGLIAMVSVVSCFAGSREAAPCAHPAYGSKEEMMHDFMHNSHIDRSSALGSPLSIQGDPGKHGPRCFIETLL